MYSVDIYFEKNHNDKTQSVIITCMYNDEGFDNNIFKTTKNGVQVYVDKIRIPPTKIESFLRDRIKDVIDSAKDSVMKRRINHSRSFSIQI